MTQQEYDAKIAEYQKKRLEVPQINTRYGLGDLVHTAAKPVVMLVNAMGGPNLGGCGGCQRRMEALNKAVPDLRHPLSRK